ncbi:hypothetical protein [Sphingomonas morindae]|uniref:Lipoprotein n=1 Tax=Sphingomonas morindae TaxID=1541170 RepID=A0ABY4XCS9_9SPHN|nr:hypothetical protein [Sphingomonas morindae]USI74776.1 hypothetical protein LHA26_18675 [Sphingomonas morindae]
MRRGRRAGVLAAAVGSAAALIGAAAPPPGDARREGLNLNAFVQQGPVAAHIVLRDGTAPRLLIAFPAGNSGVALWFAPLAAPARWTLTAPARPVTEADAQGRAMHGVRFTVRIDAPALRLRQALLTSVRVLRDYQALGTAPAMVTSPARQTGDTLRWQRDRLDGAPGYALAARVTGGRLVAPDMIRADAQGGITLDITALTGEMPLTPLPTADLLTAAANPDPAARAALGFLSYREKFLAGSWRFNTYFGRDTLLSLRLLLPALQPGAVESGLGSVLARLSPEGRVAHEEDIGEFAILDHLKQDGTRSAAPVYDYRMIDGDFLLAPVARAWLLDDPRGAARARAFLATPIDGTPAGAALVRNLRFALTRAAAFAAAPAPARLIGLQPGVPVGEWRDSNDGLGGGRYPYDVNAVLVPAALEAAAALDRAGLLAAYYQPGDAALFARAAAMAATWRDAAPPLFAVTVPAAAARAAAARFAAAQGVPAPAMAGPLRYHAIALDAAYRPVPIQNSDEGFALLFGTPDPERLAVALDTLGRPFPAGLMTGAGLLVANPAFAPPALQAKFGANAYHGMVVWSWQQALAAAGLARQRARTDLPAPLRCRLVAAETALWRAIDATRAVQSSELWSWRYADGTYAVVPFGARGKDADESNAAQLWSTVYLALHPPAAAPTCPGGASR